MQQAQQFATDVDRKLAIYYHPLFQQTINLISDLFLKNYETNDVKGIQIERIKSRKQKTFSLGLLQFVEFNLKLQKSLLPDFRAQNAIVSALNDWVKQVAQCLNFDGMVITNQCQQITDENFQSLLRTEISSSRIQLFEGTQKIIQTLLKLRTHDAFKLLGVEINKQVFSKFMFDLCSTWCQFLDIEMFVYFLTAVYLQISQGQTLADSKLKSTHEIQTIDEDFMEQFEEIKQHYAKNKKKELRYYRAWCQWNYLRVGEVGERLILCLDNILDDPRVLELAHIFQKAIKVINEQITSQSQTQSPQNTMALKEKENPQKDFLIMKKLQTKEIKVNLHQPPSLPNKKIPTQIVAETNHLQKLPSDSQMSIKNSKILQRQKSLERQGGIRINSRKQTIQQERLEPKRNQPNFLKSQIHDQIPFQVFEQSSDHHDFQIQIDEFGNMFLKRIVKLPILGQKIEPIQFQKRNQLKQKWIQKKSKQCRQISNLYRRLQNMKIRLQHNPKNDHYAYKKNTKIAQRDQFYQSTQLKKANQTQMNNNYSEQDHPVFEKSIHQRPKPEQFDPMLTQQQVKPYAKQTGYLSMLKNKKKDDGIRKNEDYIHKVMAPAFLTDQKNNISYSDKQGNIYGLGAQQERRDIKLNLPKIKFMKDYKVKNEKSFHIIGKLTKDRVAINDKVKSLSLVQQNHKATQRPSLIQTDQDKINHLKEQYHYVWNKYINDQEINELTNFVDFYQQIEKCKQKFSQQSQSEYRKNLKPILLYQNKRYEMGGLITRNQQEKFFERMKRLINKDERRKKKRDRKMRFRQYKKCFKNKRERSFFEEVFINYHKSQLTQIKEERSRIKSQIVGTSSTTR